MKKYKLDPDANTFAGCPDTYFCEYMCVNNDWYLVNAATQSGYYCPSMYHQGPAPDGTVLCIEQQQSSRSTPEFAEADGDHFVEYEYRDGKFHVSKANCPVGYHAPMDPVEFAKQHGKLRIYPARLDPKQGDA